MSLIGDSIHQKMVTLMLPWPTPDYIGHFPSSAMVLYV